MPGAICCDRRFSTCIRARHGHYWRPQLKGELNSLVVEWPNRGLLMVANDITSFYGSSCANNGKGAPMATPQRPFRFYFYGKFTLDGTILPYNWIMKNGCSLRTPERAVLLVGYLYFPYVVLHLLLYRNHYSTMTTTVITSWLPKRTVKRLFGMFS